jgi:adenylate cyclase
MAKVPDLPPGAQVNQAEWDAFFERFGHARYRRAVRVISHIPSEPRCEACGSPFGGFGGRVMRRMGKAPSRKNPRWCNQCFESSPDGGATLTIGVLFADVRGSTAMAEQTSAQDMVTSLNRFYGDATKVIVRHGIVDKLIGDEVMGVYIPALAPDGVFVDAMVTDAMDLLRAVGYGIPEGPHLEVGIGVDVGPAFVGNVGEGDVRDFTAIGDVVNTAARLQAVAEGGEVVMREGVAASCGVDLSGGTTRTVELKGKAQPVAIRTVSVASRT